MTGVTSQITLVQSGVGTVKPGEVLQLTCKVSGASLTDSSKIWAIHWVRDLTGKGLEWIGGIWHDGVARYQQSMQGRITVTRDVNKGEVYLKITGMKPEESSQYYCTKEPH
ncbi:hypothetical protein GDO86_001595 [Hymenochirus boettgeri]|uniref:Ig-like domain-containing protein n=1 Tax=Hymenochirus boettgeri TaxID=247094 RepID=A0A8T2KGI7_9PIPI|nr:hypothetical protein GDO86_001595 [Hymenochirus boettgeri]